MPVTCFQRGFKAGFRLFSGSFDDELLSGDPLFRSFAEVGKDLGAVRKDSVLQSF